MLSVDKEKGPGLDFKEPRHKWQVDLIIELSGLGGAVNLSLLCHPTNQQVAVGTVMGAGKYVQYFHSYQRTLLCLLKSWLSFLPQFSIHSFLTEHLLWIDGLY